MIGVFLLFTLGISVEGLSEDASRQFLYSPPSSFPTPSPAERSLYSHKMDEYCHKKFDKLVTSMHDFSDCIMQNSLAYDACASCGAHYTLYEKTRHDLEKDLHHKDQQNRTCAQALHDTRISLIDYQEKAPIGLWMNGSCDRCWQIDEATRNRSLHPDYAQFQDLFFEYQQCAVDFAEKGQQKQICRNCSQPYHAFVDYFQASVEVKSSYLLCIDVKQKFNASVNEWTKTFRCGKFVDRDRFVTYALSAFILILPFFFYLGAYVRSDFEKLELAKFDRRTSFEGEEDLPDEPPPMVSPPASFYCPTDASLDSEEPPGPVWHPRRPRTTSAGTYGTPPTTTTRAMPPRGSHHPHVPEIDDSLEGHLPTRRFTRERSYVVNPSPSTSVPRSVTD